MYENDGPLIRLARGASMRRSDPERKEQSCSGNAKSFLSDQVPCGSFGHPIVLDHVSPLPAERLLCRLTDMALSCVAQAADGH